LTGRRELTSDDVQRLVLEAIEFATDAQRKLALPICPNMDETRERLSNGGRFLARPLKKRRRGAYAMEYGAFEPPSTIILDSDLPFSDRPLDIPELPRSLERYSAMHEVVHADDYSGGDALYMKTRRHILDSHMDKLESGMRVIDCNGGRDCIDGFEELARLWSMQYVDMVTHYRAYVALRHLRLPRLELIWAGLGNDLFPPTLLTSLERHLGVDGVFDVITRKAGEYCIIDVLRDSESISEKNACSYTV
jgi:hypothetical protein